MARIDRILRAVESVPWAIQPEKLETLAEVLVSKAEAGQIPEATEIEAAGRRQRGRVQSQGATAVLSLFGTISRRMNMLDAMSGGSSIEIFKESMNEALADDLISTIVILVDSPGGSVYGVEELSQFIYEARQQKHIVAIADSLAASAAYYIASAASELVVTPSGEVGSIGVYMAHFDYSDALDEHGIKVTIIKAGENKAEGNPYEALQDDARAHLQSLVDDYYGQFVRAVARNRGISVGDIEERFGQGRTFTAQRALERGMVDRVATLDDVLEEIHGGQATTQIAASVDRPQLVAASEATHAWADALEPITSAVDRLVAAASTTFDGSPGRASETVIESAPTDTAQAGQEETMSGEGKVAPETGAEDRLARAQEEARAAERTRMRNLQAIGRDHQIEGDVVEKWVTNGVSVDEARASALEIIRGRAAADPTITVGVDRAVEAGFGSFGEQLEAVIQAASPGGATDKRLLHLNRIYGAATGMSQGDPASGGFVVSPSFSQRIWDGLNGEDDNLVPLTDVYTVDGESLTFNANAETSRATGSRYGGVQGYWIAEADQITSSKPKFRQATVEPQELAVLVYLTNKLLRNAPTALEQYVERAAISEIGFLSNEALIRGTGAGKPLGILNSSSLVTVAKEGSQAAATILHQNISKMWARLHPRFRRGALWLYNVDCEPELDNLFLPVTNVAGSENVGGRDQRMVSYADDGTLRIKGRPAMPVEFCSTLGTVGDIILWSPQGYLTGVRGGVETDMSIHIRFDYAESAFRFMYEIDGQPWLASALTPNQGSNTLTTHVALATRS